MRFLKVDDLPKQLQVRDESGRSAGSKFSEWPVPEGTYARVAPETPTAFPRAQEAARDVMALVDRLQARANALTEKLELGAPAVMRADDFREIHAVASKTADLCAGIREFIAAIDMVFLGELLGPKVPEETSDA